MVQALGLAIDGYVLYTVFLQNLLGKPFKSGASIARLSLAWAILGMIWAAWAWARRSGPRLIRLTAHATFVHIHVEDLGRAGQWFQANEFMEATMQAGVTRREFYLADKQERPPT